MVTVYDKGKNQKPLRYADIPQVTIDWINSIGDGIKDILSTYNPIPRPTPWDNGGDVGKEPENGLSNLEDEYFIIYYPEDLSEKADFCLRLAHQAIPRIEAIVGKYYYPKDMNGRKVPIYLAREQSDFNSLMEKFECKGDFGNVDGITIYEVSLSGLFLKAIALKGSSAFRTDVYFQEVLWHEMTHYCFGASLDYNKKIRLPMWCTEGIAEYTGITSRRPKFSQREIDEMRKDCDLSAPYFPYVFEVYSGGHSIFCYMEDTYTVSGLKTFLKTLYGTDLASSLQQNFSKTVKEFESDWKANLDRFKN